ncbi:TPA: hypothetical protein MFN52_002785 [Klebsiella quasipneumoniae subsp. similipneumoniae]|nr:hypothetical protein [Klebsiella quasipneumoniae subsp. similipneumoniae]
MTQNKLVESFTLEGETTSFNLFCFIYNWLYEVGAIFLKNTRDLSIPGRRRQATGPS